MSSPRQRESPALTWGHSQRGFKVPPGLWAFQRIWGRWSIWNDSGRLGPEIELRAEYSSDLHRYRVVRLSVEVSTMDQEVSTAMLRTIAVQRYLRELVAASAEMPRAPEGVVDYAWGVDLDVHAYWYPETDVSSPERVAQVEQERERRQISNPHTLFQVASVYRMAELANEPPAKAVAEALRLEPRTATNWIKRARESGAFERGA